MKFNHDARIQFALAAGHDIGGDKIFLAIFHNLFFNEIASAFFIQTHAAKLVQAYRAAIGEVEDIDQFTAGRTQQRVLKCALHFRNHHRRHDADDDNHHHQLHQSEAGSAAS